MKVWWQTWAKVTLEEILNCLLTRWTSPADILQPFPYFCAFSPFIYCSPPPLSFLRNPKGLAANLLLLRALLFLHFCHQGSSLHLGKNKILTHEMLQRNYFKCLWEVPGAQGLYSERCFPTLLNPSLLTKRSKTQPENTFCRDNATWGWLTSPWDQSTVPNPLHWELMCLPGPWVPHSQHVKDKENTLGLKQLFFIPGWHCTTVPSILTPQFHKPLVFCWFQTILAPLPLRKPFLLTPFLLYNSFFKLVTDTLQWGRAQKWSVLWKV